MYTSKKLIKYIFNTFGLNISKTPRAVNLPTNPLIYHKIQLVFDVGANIGQYAIESRHQGYKGKLISFEPLPEAHKILIANSKDDPLWTVHKRVAIGSNPGQTEINISENSVSSSILPMLKSHFLAAPNSAYIGKTFTDVITLDSVFDMYRKANEKSFLKIDTQGFEKEVLEGCVKNLGNIFAVQLELSIVALYDNQSLYKEFLSFFDVNGFFLWSIIPGFQNSDTGQLLQFDAIFVRGNEDHANLT